jgi:hypothetical protein
VNDEIEYIIETFKFDRVYIAMTALDWKWRNPHEVPTIVRLKQQAIILLETAYKEQITVTTGGLQAKYHPPIKDADPILSLSFVLTETDSEDF